MRGMRGFILLAGLVFLATTSLRALDDWLPISPDDLKLTSAQVGNADAIILYHESVSDDVRKHRLEYTRIKILTEKGKHYADVAIPFETEGHFNTQILDIKARSVAPDGTITPFSGQVFDRTLIKGYGVKYQAKTLTLSNVQPGSIIEWRYTEIWNDEYVIAARWIIQDELPQRHVKFSYTPIDLSGSREVQMAHGDIADNIYHLEIGLPKGTTVKVSPQGKAELELNNVPAYREEEFSPPAEMMKMRVYFYYGSRKMLKPEDFWREQGNYWSKEVDKFIAHSSAVSDAAHQAVQASDTPEQKARKIYAAVQKLTNETYVKQNSLEILADRSRPGRSAEDVLAQKSGTHNELARLYLAMLRAADVPAYLMRVATRDEVFFQEGIPEWRQLTSEVVILPAADGKEIFLDPGTPLCPFGTLEWKRTMAKGVRQKPGGGTILAETPLPNYTQAMRQRVAQVTLQEDGTLKGEMALLWMGQDAVQHRIRGVQMDEAGRKKAAEDELRSFLPATAVVKLTSIAGWDEPDQTLKAFFSVEIPGFATAAGKRIILPGGIFESRSRQTFVHEQRETPVYFEYPHRVVDTVRITLPASLKVESLPHSDPAKTDFALCKLDRIVTGNILDLRRDYALAGISFPLDQYPALKSFFEKVRSNDEEQIVLTSAAPTGQ